MNLQKGTSFGVAIVGCGTVGAAVAQLLTRDSEILRARLAPRLDLRHIVDVNFDNARRAGLDEKLFRADLSAALDDPDVRAVVELVGGTDIPRDIIAKALQAGKHVVTANKALLAYRGRELFALARKQGLTIAFEASCAGGIPIIRALCDGLIANRIDAIYGILNGTCNYILTGMTQRRLPYCQMLSDARKLGLAEADPTLDVSGTDSAHKLAILASLAFAGGVDFKKIPTDGIDRLDLCDIAYGQELGYVVKLLAIAQRRPEGLSLRVRPAFITTEHPLAWVSGPFNAVSVYGHATGHTMYYGRGAGGMPTASAVVADLAALACGTWQEIYRNLPIWPDITKPADQLPIEDVLSMYYLRVMAQDRPGVLGQVAAILGEHDISIRSVLQHEPHKNNASAGVPVVITTYRAQEGNLRAALAQIDKLECVRSNTVCIAIVDEHSEQV